MDKEMLFDIHDEFEDDNVFSDPFWGSHVAQNSLTIPLTATGEASHCSRLQEFKGQRDSGFDDILLADVHEYPTDRAKSPDLVTSNIALTFDQYDRGSLSMKTLDTESQRDKLRVKSCIENILADVQQSISDRDTLQIVLSQSGTMKSGMALDATECQSRVQRSLNFPGGTSEEAWRFTVVLCILDFIHEALTEQVVISKRDIYYKAPALFGKQAVVDRYIDEIAGTFGVPRSALNVTAASKGIATGAFNLLDDRSIITESGSSDEGIVIRRLRPGEILDMSRAQFVLVIEKEATFRAIVGSPFWQAHKSQVVAITAKGYPDIASRAFLQLLTRPSSYNAFRAISAHCLVDYDPDGIAIYSTYKNGSLALAHENEHLVAPELHRIGLSHRDVAEIFLLQDEFNNNDLLRLSLRDRRHAIRALQRHLDRLVPDADITGDLQNMLMLNIKCEIQALDHGIGGLNAWLEAKIGPTC